jgi:ankyrin repeat protein
MRVRELAETALLSSDVQQRLEHQLLQMEHRTYLWLHLAINDIRITFNNSLRPAEESIRLIPPSVDAAYGKILARVPSNQVNTVRKILQIIVGARRPLTTQEMAMALGIALCPKSRSAAKAGINPVRLAAKIRQLCGLFVFINNSKIYLIHQTARDFLINRGFASNPNSIYAFKQTDAESLMSQVCMRYLLMDDLEQRERQTDTANRSLLEYSAVHWPDHVRNVSPTQQQEIDDLLYQLYRRGGERGELWFEEQIWRATMMFAPTSRMMFAPMPRKMDAIHLAAFNGHTRMVQKLLADNHSDINKADTTGSNALIWASLYGHTRVTKLLLQQGADANALGRDYGSALQAASSRGYDKVAQMLLQHGADAKAGPGAYALYDASSRGYSKIVQMLLQRGADANAQCGLYGKNALYLASSEGHDKVVWMLLQHGADAKAAQGEEALYAASNAGHDRIVQMLLQHGANANAQGGRYINAYHADQFLSHQKIAEARLQYGIPDVNVHIEEYGNALYAASSKGHDKIVKMLLQRGADANAQCGWYRNALCAASYEGHGKVVWMLLQHGADAKAAQGEEALYAASNAGNDKIVQMLLQRGANANAQIKGTEEYGSALYAASSGGHDKVVQILLERGADANAQGGKYGNALCAASSGGHDKVVQLLLQH